MSSEYFEIGDTVPYEALNVVVGAFEGFGLVTEDGLYLVDRREPVMGVGAGGSLVRGSSVIVGSGDGEPVHAWPGASEQVTSQFLPLLQVLDLLFQVIGSLSLLMIQGTCLFDPFGIGSFVEGAVGTSSLSLHLVIASRNQSTRPFLSIPSLSL